LRRRTRLVTLERCRGSRASMHQEQSNTSSREATAANASSLTTTTEVRCSRVSRVRRSCGWRVHAYCLMDTHLHAVVETPEPTLGSGMRFLQPSTRSVRPSVRRPVQGIAGRLRRICNRGLRVCGAESRSRWNRPRGRGLAMEQLSRDGWADSTAFLSRDLARARDARPRPEASTGAVPRAGVGES
jgi:REP element-mobilizing transposase RayT